MIIAGYICAFLFAGLLVLVTLAQMIYMDTLRLRTRELPFLDYFREHIEQRIALKAEKAVLTFSLFKHSLLALLGLIFLFLLAYPGPVTLPVLLEACALTWATMLTSTYIVPQLLYRQTSGRWLVAFLPLLRLTVLVIRPLTAALGFFQSLVELNGRRHHDEQPASQEENIEALITAGTEEGIFEEEDRKLIHSVVAFGSKTVREVMTPRPSMVTIQADSTLEELRKLVLREQYSRIPVYDGSIDQIIGFIHVRDMFELDETERISRTVRELVRPIRFVPETKPVNDILREMQQTGAHMVIVVDEYGNTAGLATMEDMVEEIVGEIRDEHEPGNDVQPDPEGGYIVSGSFDIDHLHELLDVRAPEETESTTVGGLVTEWMGRVPAPGEGIERDGIRIDVLASNELRVDQVRISRAEQTADA
jgi:CBS domain containing-hemolysin-like protein